VVPVIPELADTSKYGIKFPDIAVLEFRSTLLKYARAIRRAGQKNVAEIAHSASLLRDCVMLPITRIAGDFARQAPRLGKVRPSHWLFPPERTGHILARERENAPR
jgi:hypothetical protein